MIEEASRAMRRHKYGSYLKYLLKHKWYVMLECWKFGLYWRGIVHDISKFSPSEFVPYARRFYEGDGCSKELLREFTRAVTKHYLRNDHHPEYWWWAGTSIVITPMPKRAIKEMLCDWKITGKMKTGCNDNKEIHKFYAERWASGENASKTNKLTRARIQALLYAMYPLEETVE